jgi:hypothetical protein
MKGLDHDQLTCLVTAGLVREIRFNRSGRFRYLTVHGDDFIEDFLVVRHSDRGVRRFRSQSTIERFVVDVGFRSKLVYDRDHGRLSFQKLAG